LVDAGLIYKSFQISTPKIPIDSYADKNVFKGKVGMGIAVGGDRNGGQEFALMQIHTFYIINGMIPVGGGFFGANLGATFWSKDTLEGVKSDEEGFRSLKKTVKWFAENMEKYQK